MCDRPYELNEELHFLFNYLVGFTLPLLVGWLVVGVFDETWTKRARVRDEVTNEVLVMYRFLRGDKTHLTKMRFIPTIP